MKRNNSSNLEIAVFGGGCFWCLEPIFSHTRGVVSVTPGYAGGDKDNPSYGEVSTGKTGHAEAIKIEFNPNVITYEELLHIFFSLHDPTTSNRQGNDIGTQYRSIILFGSEEQKQRAEKVMREIEEEKLYENPIVTEIKPLDDFWEAEGYHKNYFKNNPEKAYCQLVIAPKMAKFRQKYAKYYQE